MTTLLDIRTLTSNDILRDAHNRVWTFSILDRAINQAYKRVQQDMYWMLDGDMVTTINTTANVQNYNLPDEINFIEKVTLTEWNKKLDRTTRTETGVEVGSPREYFVENKQIWLYPVPTTNGAITIMYSWMFPALSLLTDELLTIPELDRAIASLASSILLKQVMRLDQAQVREQEYMVWISKAKMTTIRDLNLSFITK